MSVKFIFVDKHDNNKVIAEDSFGSKSSIPELTTDMTLEYNDKKYTASGHSLNITIDKFKFKTYTYTIKMMCNMRI